MSDLKPAASARPPPRLRLALALVVAGALLGGILRPGAMQRLGLLDENIPWFLDSYALLATSDAVQAGRDPWQRNPLDVYHRAHSYSDWWFVLGDLGLKRSDNFLLGGAMVALFLGVAWLLLAPRSRAELAWQVALVLSPPVLLAVNRANNDLVIFALLGLGLWLVRRASTGRLAGYGAAVALATGLKFYPMAAAGAVMLLRPARRGVVWAAALSAAALLVFASVYQDFLRAEFPAPIGVYLFGATVFWKQLGLEATALVPVSLVLLAAGALLLAWRGHTTGLTDGDAGDEGERLAFLAGALLLLACFAGGTSYAYRWIFALWLLPWLWRRGWLAPADAPGRMMARGTALLLTIVMWMDGFFCLALNSAGAITESAMLRAFRTWNLCTQPLVWMLMALLAGWLAAALLATWRELRRPAAKA